MERPHAGARTGRRGGRGLRLRPAERVCRRAWPPGPRRRCGSTSNTSAPKPTCSAATACRRRSSSGPGQGLRKWFFYPGFGAGTGGLLREPVLMEERRSFDAGAWLRARGLQAAPGERVVSLFCYDSAPVAQLLDHLAAAPTLLLATPGSAQRALRAWVATHGAAARLRCIDLPWFTQADFDRLLWACDLNFVRGEDSFVRAMWAGAAFRLADLPAARRSARWQARSLPGALSGRRRTRLARGRAGHLAGLERAGDLAGRDGAAGPVGAAGPALARRPAGAAGPGDPTARLRERKALKLQALRAGHSSRVNAPLQGN